MVDSPNVSEGVVGSIDSEIENKNDVVEKKSANLPVAPSPNTMRKRRHFEIAKKVEMRKALITTASSSRLDIGKVHSILSGPRLSWDASKSASLSMRGGENEDEDESCGLIVEDFHADSRSALRTNISKALSQMASRDINTQQISETNSQLQADEEIQKIIELKKKLIRKESKIPVATLRSVEADLAQDDEEEDYGGIGENLPVLEPIEEEKVVDNEATQDYVHRPVIAEDDAMSPTQIFQRQDESEEELDMDSLAMKPTQVYLPPSREEGVENVGRIESKSSIGSSRSSALPPNTVREDIAESSVEESEEEEEEMEIPTEVPSQIKKRDQLEFARWLAARKDQKKKRRKEKGKDEARMFFEAEAEESEDEELGGIMRRKRGDDSDGSSPDSSSDELDSDLEDLVASAADEFVLEKKSGKDSRKLAKLHAKWAEERDAALEKAIEDREFMRRKQGGASRLLMDEGVEGGLNRMQRKLKARRDAMVEQFDREGNLLAPEYASDSDYDSMEIDSDDFFDEDDEEERGEVDPAELEARKERKERDQERRKKEMEFKLEMKKRRQLLKEKLRQERIMREKDKREIQSGVGIMNEEDREVFKLVNRSQVFGYIAGKDGTATQSTVASSTASSQFSFLGGQKSNVGISGRRRSSAVALELE